MKGDVWVKKNGKGEVVVCIDDGSRVVEKVISGTQVITGKSRLRCGECGKVFWKRLPPRTFEVECPNCHGVDVEPS